MKIRTLKLKTGLAKSILLNLFRPGDHPECRCYISLCFQTSPAKLQRHLFQLSVNEKLQSKLSASETLLPGRCIFSQGRKVVKPCNILTYEMRLFLQVVKSELPPAVPCRTPGGLTNFCVFTSGLWARAWSQPLVFWTNKLCPPETDCMWFYITAQMVQHRRPTHVIYASQRRSAPMWGKAVSLLHFVFCSLKSL